MAARKCAACQAEMDADAIFCNECGLAQPVPQIDVPPPTIHVPSRSEPANPFAPAATIHASPPVDFTTKECPQCGTAVARNFKFCSKCAFNFEQVPAEPEPITAPSLAPKIAQAAAPKPDGWFSPALTASVKKRYREGYIYARSINGFGALAIVFGVILAGISFLAAVLVGGGVESAASRAPFGGGPSGAGAVIGFIIFIIGMIFSVLVIVLGILIRAGAQLLKASLDTAVHSSPFLADADRAEMMSLPTFGAYTASGNVAKFN